jgi:hypothetical protein
LSPASRSNAGMANRQGDVDLRLAQVSAPQLELWLGLAWRGGGKGPFANAPEKAVCVTVQELESRRCVECGCPHSRLRCLEILVTIGPSDIV